MASMGVIVAERMEAALEGPDAMGRSFLAPSFTREEPTAGQLLAFVLVTGLDPRLLLSGVEDVERGLDDLPRFDTYRVAESDEL